MIKPLILSILIAGTILYTLILILEMQDTTTSTSINRLSEAATADSYRDERTRKGQFAVRGLKIQ
jgi:hypothetical protein